MVLELQRTWGDKPGKAPGSRRGLAPVSYSTINHGEGRRWVLLLQLHASVTLAGTHEESREIFEPRIMSDDQKRADFTPDLAHDCQELICGRFIEARLRPLRHIAKVRPHKIPGLARAPCGN